MKYCKCGNKPYIEVEKYSHRCSFVKLRCSCGKVLVTPSIGVGSTDVDTMTDFILKYWDHINEVEK
jgi:hypothetical protein